MKDARLIMEEFCDMTDDLCAFDLKNGFHYEGYAFEVENEHLVFGGGGPMAPKEDLFIPVQDIDLSTLAYWDENKGCYMDAEWNEQQGSWIFKRSR